MRKKPRVFFSHPPIKELFFLLLPLITPMFRDIPTPKHYLLLLLARTLSRENNSYRKYHPSIKFIYSIKDFRVSYTFFVFISQRYGRKKEKEKKKVQSRHLGKVNGAYSSGSREILWLLWTLEKAFFFPPCIKLRAVYGK